MNEEENSLKERSSFNMIHILLKYAKSKDSLMLSEDWKKFAEGFLEQCFRNSHRAFGKDEKKIYYEKALGAFFNALKSVKNFKIPQTSRNLNKR